MNIVNADITASKESFLNSNIFLFFLNIKINNFNCVCMESILLLKIFSFTAILFEKLLVDNEKILVKVFWIRINITFRCYMYIYICICRQLLPSSDFLLHFRRNN